MTKRRWSKFWWQDYERDPALRLCSLAAQGLWMRLLCLMHEADPYGYLCVNHRPLHTRQLAQMLGVAERQIQRLMAELREAGVYSTTPEGLVFCRRLLRDKAASDLGAQWGRTGGNPRLKPASPQPASSQPEAAQPMSSRLVSSQPGGTQPMAIQPITPLPVVAHPPAAQPVAAQPVARPAARAPSSSVQPGAGEVITPVPPAPLKHQEAEAESEAESSLTSFGPECDARTHLFNAGLLFLKRVTGRPDRAARALLGKWLKMLADDAAILLAVLAECQAFNPAEPVSWLEATIRHRLAAQVAHPDGPEVEPSTLQATPKATPQTAPAAAPTHASPHATRMAAWAAVPDLEGV